MSLLSIAIENIATHKATVQSLWKWGGASVSFLLPFLVYLGTLAPTVYGLDSAELTTGAYCLGLVHAPGYPLYLLIGHLFTLLPIGNVGYRMNLMSAFFGALAATFLYLVLCRLCRRPLAALSATLLLAYSFFFWSPSVMAEVYTLQAFLMVALMLIVLIWQEQRNGAWLSLFAFAFGLGLGNHLSTLMLLPGLLYWLLVTDHKQVLRPKQVVAMLSFFALGLAVYLYLPLRYAAHPPAVGAMPIRAGSWQEVLDIASARTFWGLMFAYGWPEIGGQVADYLYCLWGNFMGIGLVIGVWGGIVSARKRRHLVVGLALMFLANVVFFAAYGAGDKRIMFLPSYVIWAIWIGLGFDWLLDQMDSLSKRMAGARPWRIVISALLPGLAVVALLVNYQYADLSGDWRTYNQATRVFDTVEPGAYVLATSWFKVAPLEYLHVVEQRRLDVTVLNVNELPVSELYGLLEAEAGIRPFYRRFGASRVAFRAGRNRPPESTVVSR